MASETPGYVNIRHQLLSPDYLAIASLWGDVGWGSPDQEATVKQVLSASQWIGIAEIDGHFAGYGRAFSDGVVVTYIAEVAVIPSMRRKGVATALVRDCLDCCRSTAVYADANAQMLPLLEKLGLLPRPRYLTACSRGPQRLGD